MAEVAVVVPIGLVGFPAELVSAARNDLAVQPLHVVAVLDEGRRQVVQQRFVAGRVGQAVIIGRIDNADVEVAGPDSIDECPGEQAVVLATQPVHQRRANVVKLCQVDLFVSQQPGRRSHASRVATLAILGEPFLTLLQPGDRLLNLLDLSGLAIVGLEHLEPLLLLGELLPDLPGCLATGVLVLLVLGRGLLGRNDIDLLERHRLAFEQGLTDCLPRLAALLVTKVQRRHQLVVLGPRLRIGPEIDAGEEALELGKVVLGPLVEGMLVALGTLDTDTQERVGKADRPFLWLPERATSPVVRHPLSIDERLGPLLPIHPTHRLAELLERLPGVPARGHHQSLDQLVVGHVFGDTILEPVVPVLAGAPGFLGSHVVQRVVVVSGEVRETGRPPGGVGRPRQQFLDLLGPFLWIGVFQERRDFGNRRQGANQVQ